VDDNPDTLSLVRYLLGPRFDVAVFETAEQALAASAPERWAAVLLDINLGTGGNGVELLRELRKRGGDQVVPVIALTAYALPGDAERFLALGFDAYLPKPFTRAQLLGVLVRVLEKRKRRSGEDPAR
jgi:CheY-like chemotaxis protein